MVIFLIDRSHCMLIHFFCWKTSLHGFWRDNLAGDNLIEVSFGRPRFSHSMAWAVFNYKINNDNKIMLTGKLENKDNAKLSIEFCMR